MNPGGRESGETETSAMKTSGMKAFAERHCRVLPAGTPALAAEAVQALLHDFPGWTLQQEAIRKSFRFADYPRTLAFVNAVAWIAQQQDHHPELQVTYDRCEVAYNTHSIGGISENDFICAARIESLIE